MSRPNDKRHRLIAGIFLLVTSAAFAADDPDALNLAVADRHVIPGYAHLAEQTARLDKAARARCADGHAGRQAMQERFADAFLAWQDIQHIRFGPIQVLARDFRFQLWPDRRGSVRKHLARLMASRDPARLEAETFAAGSVAVQGFGALERLLFDPPPTDDDAAWRCAVITAMTANLARMADDTLREWRAGESPHRAQFATASGGNDFYDSAAELSARLLNNLHTQLERMVDQKLARPLGGAAEQAMPKRAEAWRSGQSLAALRHNLAAVEGLYRSGFAPRRGDRKLAAAIDSRLAAAGEAVAGLDMPLARAVSDPAGRRALQRMHDELAALKTLVGSELAPALGLPLGFNSLDGD